MFLPQCGKTREIGWTLGQGLHVLDWLVLMYPPHLRRTGFVSLVVGSWLTGFKLGEVLLEQGFGVVVGGKIVLHYLTPFLVAKLGLMSRQVALPGRTIGS